MFNLAWLGIKVMVSLWCIGMAVIAVITLVTKLIPQRKPQTLVALSLDEQIGAAFAKGDVTPLSQRKVRSHLRHKRRPKAL